MTVSIFNTIISFGVLISNVLFVIFLFLYFFHRSFAVRVEEVISKYILHFIFLFSLGSLVGSLIYSDLLNFPPCLLCWYQRILMYPQVLITFLAILKRDKGVIDYLLPLSVLGIMISLYQSLVNWGFSFGSTLPCLAEGGECSKLYVYEYGYITIPFMALSVFVYMMVLSLIYKKVKS